MAFPSATLPQSIKSSQPPSFNYSFWIPSVLVVLAACFFAFCIFGQTRTPPAYYVFQSVVKPFQLNKYGHTDQILLWYLKMDCKEPYLMGLRCNVTFSLNASLSEIQDVVRIEVDHEPGFLNFSSNIKMSNWQKNEQLNNYAFIFHLRTTPDQYVTLSSFALKPSITVKLFFMRGGKNEVQVKEYSYLLSIKVFSSLLPNIYKAYKASVEGKFVPPQNLNILVYGAARSGKSTILSMYKSGLLNDGIGST